MQLTLENVRKEYGETVALGGSDESDGRSGVDLDVDDGEFFTLVGPSGCGKTTTLRLVAGFETPSTGSVRFGGREMRGVPPEERDVGVVFQNYALFPHLSVAENVAYGLRFSDPPGGESRDERVASLLELVDLPDAGDRDPTQLSGGQQQRVALARALAPGPDLLLLDEPMSALDARLRERLRLQVKEIQSTLGITTLYVTHDQEEALAISDRVAVMSDGAVEQVGTPREVYRRPETRFVAEFVGDNNVFKGRVVSSRAVDEFEEIRGSVAVGGESPVETEGYGWQGERGRTVDRPQRVELDVGGTTITIVADSPVETADRVAFCVRPEQIRVLAGGTEDMRSEAGRSGKTGSEPGKSRTDTETNVLDATVSGTEFLGESTRTYLQWNDRELTVRSANPLSGEVRIAFDATAARVVDVERGG